MCFRPLIGVIISKHTNATIADGQLNSFRPLIGVIISKRYDMFLINDFEKVSVPLSGLLFLNPSASSS